MKRKKSYWVDCIIWKTERENNVDVIHYTPIFNHSHTDVENGQKEAHYHMDDRFAPIGNNNTTRYVYTPTIRPVKTIETVIKKLKMQFIHRVNRTTTPVSFISKSKIKHDCMKNGKCPHRGFDLTGIEPDIYGIVTCPLHGLKIKQ